MQFKDVLDAALDSFRETYGMPSPASNQMLEEFVKHVRKTVLERKQPAEPIAVPTQKPKPRKIKI